LTLSGGPQVQRLTDLPVPAVDQEWSLILPPRTAGSRPKAVAHPRSAALRQRRRRLCRGAVRPAKQWTELPANGLARLDETRSWAAEFVCWYDVEHRHSGIRYLSPQEGLARHGQTTMSVAGFVALIAGSLLGPAGGARPEAAVPASSAQSVCCRDQLLRTTLGGVQVPLMIDGSDQ